jgi:hypothetical protein
MLLQINAAPNESHTKKQKGQLTSLKANLTNLFVYSNDLK